MEQIRGYIEKLFASGCERVILSKPVGNAEYKKIVIEEKSKGFQIEKFTATQAFHENCTQEEAMDKTIQWMMEEYHQLNGFGGGLETILMISKKKKVTFKQKRSTIDPVSEKTHNRKKHYLLEEGEIIPPLIDMGIFTAEGRIIPSMYDKFKQINRFIEMIDDYVKQFDKEELHIIDFGCGKSYLTFILYYYLTVKSGRKVSMVGLDLKEDVIEKCNAAAKKYGYDGLNFELGDINGYKAPFEVDMVVSLHACDTATDYALYNAICWNADMIFSVPCCQHELNQQMDTENLTLFTRYGIIKERMAALMTDAIRANLLESCGYKTQVLEFVDLSHTPKNLLIRAKKKSQANTKYELAKKQEARQVMEEFHLKPTLYQLLEEDKNEGE